MSKKAEARLQKLKDNVEQNKQSRINKSYYNDMEGFRKQQTASRYLSKILGEIFHRGER